MDAMAGELNATRITFGGHVELHRFRFLYFAVMLVVYVLIICSNSTILSLIWLHKSLHEPMYVFIAALLFNSLLFSAAVYPKLLVDFLSEEQTTSLTLCSLQSFTYYTLCGAEFLLLSAMAYDRYVSICRPLQYEATMRRNTVVALLALAWLLPACQLVPSLFISSSYKLCRSTLSGIFCNNAISQLFCMDSRASYVTYGVFIVLNTIVLPMAFILFTYAKILVVSLRGSGRMRRKAARTCSPHLLVLTSFSCLCSYDVVVARLQVDLDRTVRFVMTLQVLYHPLFNPIIYGWKVEKIHRLLRTVLYGDKRKVNV
ncbi:olfactory receptor 11A1-like [Poeciliopsis prolifica]|uniref:olfactory receptor 11A1-like n=1 Tax=Poeciliopsis prolifica TaxID=188132 RepID=UPI0024145A3C|nr:olfactory receptor 11A1-like [Poeciliopsis prolifica]